MKKAAVIAATTINQNDAILVNQKQGTSVDGVFAAGDCTGSFKQIPMAVGQGVVAGKSIIEYVRSLVL